MKRQHINTDNYEEFFLLYVDNELTAAERESVEAFVQEHPELKNELQVFLDTRLDMEETSFDGKEILFRNEERINEQNIEEFQVLLIDGELDPVTAAEVEAYSSARPLATRNLDQLRKTKLSQEDIRFPDKATLYRSEKKPAAVISIQWYRIAAAAAILLIAGLLWLNRASEHGTMLPIAATEEKHTDPSTAGSEKTKDSDDRSVSSPSPVNDDAGTNEKMRLAEGQSNTAPGNTKNTNIVNQKIEKQEQKQVTNYAALAAPDGKNIPETIDVTRNATTEVTTTNINTNAPDPRDQKAITTAEATPRQALAMNVKTDYVSEAIYESSVAQEEINDEDQKQRKGLRGLVRKANRIYNKVTNPDPDKTSLVKVANFEIGLPR